MITRWLTLVDSAAACAGLSAVGTVDPESPEAGDATNGPTATSGITIAAAQSLR
jgi:hypothetical protein